MAVNEWESDFMDVAETARVLHVPVSWVYERTRRRGRDRIPHIKLGKYLRFVRAEVLNWAFGLRSALMERAPHVSLPADAPPPKRATFGGRMSRKRCYQEGSLFKRGT